jgi:hypothetical protein
MRILEIQKPSECPFRTHMKREFVCRHPLLVEKLGRSIRTDIQVECFHWDFVSQCELGRKRSNWKKLFKFKGE